MAKLTKDVDRWFYYGQLSQTLGSSSKSGQLLTEVEFKSFYAGVKDLADKLYGITFDPVLNVSQMINPLNRFFKDTGLPYEVKRQEYWGYSIECLLGDDLRHLTLGEMINLEQIANKQEEEKK